jgi:hypothetical protein
MLTRRSFLGTLAAVAASRVAPVPVVAAIPLAYTDDVFVTATSVTHGRRWLTPAECRALETRRDDGDTILELR